SRSVWLTEAMSSRTGRVSANPTACPTTATLLASCAWPPEEVLAEVGFCAWPTRTANATPSSARGVTINNTFLRLNILTSWILRLNGCYCWILEPSFLDGYRWDNLFPNAESIKFGLKLHCKYVMFFP